MTGVGLSQATIEAQRGRPLEALLTVSAPTKGRRGGAGKTGTPWTPVTLSLADQHNLLDAWAAVFADVYVHYNQKRALYGFDPARAIDALRRQLHYLDSSSFLRELTLLINRLRDQHTQLYVGSASANLNGHIAVLPFMVEVCGPRLSPTYLVTKVVNDHPHFTAGAQVTTWNAVPLNRAVDLYGDTLTGGRPDSRRARALETLTQRPLEFLPLPDERWVDIGYRAPGDGASSRERHIRFTWQVIAPDKAPTAARGPNLLAHRAINATAETARRARKLLFAPQLWEADRHRVAAAKSKGWLSTSFPDAVSARTFKTKAGETFGYLRLWTFDVDHGEHFVAEVARLLTKLPTTGLIVDLRSNPGGVIDIAERLLQLFTTNHIHPARFALRATRLMADLAQANANGFELGDWATSTNANVALGEPYSQHLPISDEDACNDRGCAYTGPIVAVIDANTFSCGDLFAAGIVDHDIGRVISIGEASGAGGANVWDSGYLADAYRAAGREFPALPAGISFSVAVRRMVRTGYNNGVAIEDVGIPGDETHVMTADDLLHGNRDLIEFCAKVLRQS